MKKEITNIKRIGIVKETGDEWSTYTKSFEIKKLPDFAAIRVDAMGVCGICVNGEFLEGTTGRYAGRVAYFEFTSKVKTGVNEITIKMGDHYHQIIGLEIRQRRGKILSAVGAEIEFIYGNERKTMVTDESWILSSDDGQTVPHFYSEVTCAEYDRLWRAAALWKEQKEIVVPDAVKKFAGEEYVSYAQKTTDKYSYPLKVFNSNMFTLPDGTVTSRVSDMGAVWLFDDSALPTVCYDFGRLQVGYLEIEYEADADTAFEARFDYSEHAEDLLLENRHKGWVTNLQIRTPLKKGRHTVMLNHRRAFRFLRLHFEGQFTTVHLFSVRVRQSLMPYENAGWFNCNDEMLNKAWEVGKYTLHVNKHEEYESCPRTEMKFFSGDGVVDALIDQYAFGDMSLIDSSLSHTEIASNGGIIFDKIARNVGLSDYPAWRIITVHNYYIYSGDIELVRRYFSELETALEWLIGKLNSRYLFYQFPIFDGAFYNSSGSVEYNCSPDRLGEKPMLNAMVYRSLICMAEMGEALGEGKSEAWRDLAQKVKDAINKELWSDEKGAYVDLFDTSYIPQDGNALALLFGIADKERAQKIFKTLERENWSPYGSAILSKETTHTRGGRNAISPLMCTYEAEARFILGDSEGAMELIRRVWGTMLKMGARTFWEFMFNNDKDRWRVPAHAWSAGCTYLLSAYVSGVRPANVGFKKIHYAPCTELERFVCVVPTANGLVVSKCSTVDGIKKFELLVPNDVEVESVIPEGADFVLTKY